MNDDRPLVEGSVPIQAIGKEASAILRAQGRVPTLHVGWARRPLVPGRVLVAALAALSAGACTFTGGQMAYLAGFGKGPQIKAEHEFGDKKLLVFVDDVHDQVDWPSARSYLFDEVSQTLLRNKAASKIIPPQTLEAVRTTLSDFRRRGCREIGERVGADEVLWIEVHDFLADEQFTEANDAALWTVAIKVLNVHETESRSRVRLWPRSPEGKLVHASLTGSQIQMLSGTDEIARELAQRLGRSIARFFYDHYEEDE